MGETVLANAEATAIIPLELIERIEQGECTLFVGPGASLPEAAFLGPPGPATLAAEMALRIESLPPDITLPWVAQLYEERFGKQDLRDFVARRLDDPRYRPTLIHYWVASLPFDIIISTAHDQLLDRLLQQQNPTIRRVLEDEDLPPFGEPQLIKLYGTVAQPATLRVTEEDLESLFERLPGIAESLHVISRTHTLLFIGFYLGDATFRRLFSMLRMRLIDRAPAAFVIHPRPDPMEEAYWRRHVLITIPIEPAVFLAELDKELARRKGTSPSLAPRPDRPPQLDEDTHCQHNKVVAQILKQMGLGGTAEGGSYLQSATYNLDFVRQLMAEHVQVTGSKAEPLTAASAADPIVKASQARIFLQYGNAEWAEGDRDQAKQHFENALQLDPHLVDAYFSLHYLLAEVGKSREALDIYRQVLVVAPERAFLPPHYEIQAVLGVGILGIIYRVKDTLEDKDLSVTVLRSALTRDLEALDDFREAMARLQYPRIPRFIATGHHNGRYFIAREHTDGSSLAQRMDGQPLRVAEALSILDQVAEVLEYSHEQGVPHLGLNPSSILLTGEQGAMVTNLIGTDLAASRLYPLSRAIKMADYLAPEQQVGDQGNKCSDIYALGTVAYEMLTGHLPGTGAFEPPSEVNPDADVALDIIVARARDMDPGHRFSSMAEMRGEIQRIARINLQGWERVIQPIRQILNLTSRGLDWLLRPTSLAVFIALLIVAGLTEALPLVPHLHFASRLLLLLSLNVVPASFFSYSLVRETAQRTGLGSLIHSGRGMGGVFGGISTLWELWKTAWSPGAEWHLNNPVELSEVKTVAEGGHIISILLVAPMLTLFLTYLMLSLVQFGGYLTHRYWKSYTRGFYIAFLLWCLFFLLTTWNEAFHGILEVPR